MIRFKHRGNFNKTEKFLTGYGRLNFRRVLESYGQKGVDALASATPIDSGLTASSWYYTIEITKTYFTVSWMNSNVVSGVPIAIILQYGHGTGTGGYVEGIDYINPALKPIFDSLAEDIWREVVNL